MFFLVLHTLPIVLLVTSFPPPLLVTSGAALFVLSTLPSLSLSLFSCFFLSFSFPLPLPSPPVACRLLDVMYFDPAEPDENTHR